VLAWKGLVRSTLFLEIEDCVDTVYKMNDL
jgi:hypothetical protein